MPNPVLVAVDEDAGALRDVERELGDQWGRTEARMARPQ
jgi:hypothetical protein